MGLFRKHIARKSNNTFEWKGKTYSYAIRNDNLHIVDSYTISKDDFNGVLNLLRGKHQNCQVWKRTNKSLDNEWAVHNLCYCLGLWKSQTKDVDLNYPQTFWEKIGYGIFGPIAKLFIC